MKIQNLFHLLALVLFVSFFIVPQAPGQATIAFWPLQSADPGADVSGNGHALNVSNLTFVADAPASAPHNTQSAVFDGATSFAATVTNLDMSPYSAFTIEWFMKSTQPNVGFIFEFSPNYNSFPGSFFADINDAGPGSLVWATDARAGTNGANQYTIESAFSGFPQDGQWHHYAVTANTAVTNFSTRLEVWVDGQYQTNVSQGIGAGTFDSYQLFIGSRAGSALFLNGQLDDLKISQGVLTPDQFMIHVAYPTAQFGFSSQPTNATITEASPPRAFQAGVNATNIPLEAVLFQWQSEAPGSNQWVSIPGAILSSYAAPTGTPSGTQFRVIASAPGGPSITSTAATLTINPMVGSTIAYWRFQAASPEADSSGNGNVLSLFNLTFASDGPDGAPDSAHSAVFDGASSFAETTSTLNMSPYSAFTIEWYMKSTQPNVGFIFELSPNANNSPGSFFADINDAGLGSLVWDTDSIGGGSDSASAANGFPQDGLWHHYAVAVDTTITNLPTRLEIWLDGILQTNANSGLGSGAFGTYQLFIGSRAGQALFLNGQLNDIRISKGLLTPDQFLIQTTYPTAQLGIGSQPLNGTTTVGSPPVTFSVGVNATNAPVEALLYQWQVELPGSNQWTSIPGAILPSYQVKEARIINSGTKYRVIATAPGGPSITSSAATLTVNPPTSPTIAYWRFAADNPGADSSGNGHDLDVENISFTTDAPTNAPDNTNSVVFDGASSFAKTIDTLDMSPYSAFTLEWYMKSGQPNVGFIFELSPNYNDARYPGAFFLDLNDAGPASLVWATRTAESYAIQSAPGDFLQDGNWHHYAASVNTIVTNQTSRLAIWVDGILQTNTSGGIGAGTFGNYQLFIGSRNASALLFNGQLDDLRVSQGALTPDQFLIHLTYPAAQLGIGTQPASVTVASGQTATFQVSIDATNIPVAAVLYQWQSEDPGTNQWVSIAGAVLPYYQVTAQPGQNGTKYRVIASPPGGGTSVTSGVATLNVGLGAIGFTFSGGMLNLSWGSGILQSTTNLPGPWQDVVAGTNAYLVNPTNAQMFYRLR